MTVETLEREVEDLKRQLNPLLTHPFFVKMAQGGPLAIPKGGFLIEGRHMVGGAPTDGQVMTWDNALQQYRPEDLPTGVGSLVSPSATVISETAHGQASAAGSASAYSRGDHTHGTPPAGAGYTDAEAILAVEGEATLVLSGAVAVTGDLTLTAAILLGNPGIEDDGGVQRIGFRGPFPFFAATAATFKVAVSGNTIIVEDGDLRMDDGDVNIQANNLRSTNVDMLEASFANPTGVAFRVQPRSGNNAVALEAVPSGTATVAIFTMFNAAAAAAANRVRFGVGPDGLGIELASGMDLDFGITGVTAFLHLTATEGNFTQPLLVGADADPSHTLDVSGSFGAQITAISTATTLDDTYHIVTCDASGGAFTVTLPAASGITGRIYHIKKTDSSANAVTVDGNASETIDGATTAALSAQYESIMISCDGSNWHII